MKFFTFPKLVFLILSLQIEITTKIIQKRTMLSVETLTKEDIFKSEKSKPVFCKFNNRAMPGRMDKGRCVYIPNEYSKLDSPAVGLYNETPFVVTGLEYGELTDPNQATFKECFTYGNYHGSLVYNPVWHIATVYKGEVYIGSTSWFDRAEIVVDSTVIPVSDFKIFCTKRN